MSLARKSAAVAKQRKADSRPELRIVDTGAGFRLPSGRIFRTWRQVLGLCKKLGVRPVLLPRHQRGRASPPAEPDTPASDDVRAKIAALQAKIDKLLIEEALEKGSARQPKEALQPAFAPGPRARALLRGIEIAEEDLRSSGGAFDLNHVRELMHGVTRQSIDKYVKEGRLLAVPGPSNKRRFPAVQFKDDGTVIDGLENVQKALPTTSGFAVLNFLIRPHSRLDGRKPIDLLKAGEIDLVVQAARRMGEQGA
jgi:hypothetical protein